MSDINQQMFSALLDSSRALITSNESISESVRANSEASKANNQTVKELTVVVTELVATERERSVKDNYQHEVNVKQEIINTGILARLEGSHDTIVRVKRFHKIADSVATKIIALFAVALLAILGFNFK